MLLLIKTWISIYFTRWIQGFNLIVSLPLIVSYTLLLIIVVLLNLPCLSVIDKCRLLRLVVMYTLLHCCLLLLLFNVGFFLLLVFLEVEEVFRLCVDLGIVLWFLVGHLFFPFLFFYRIYNEDGICAEVIWWYFSKSFVFEFWYN